ncbi:MAG TPA: D-2-hydroxyacid dehydrogenase [Chthoniobacterales bacterium]
MGQLTIWTNALLNERAASHLREACQAHRLILASPPPDVLSKGAPDLALQEAQVAFGQPDPDLLTANPDLRWVHLSSAGYARYDTAALRSRVEEGGLLVTNSSWVFAEPCAQHALAFILAHSRQLHAAYEVQRTDRSWPHVALRARCHLLENQVILLAGFGSIGARLAELLAPFHARVLGLRRRKQSLPQVELIDETQLPEALAAADHVVNILPENGSTPGFFGAARFNLFKPGACYYSIGRGATTDQQALADALSAGRLAGAYLDVTDPEPLPPDHPLWFAPRCYITPHSSGGHANEPERMVEHFLRNLRRFEQGQPLEGLLLQP